MDIATVGVAAQVVPEDGVVKEVKIVLGATGPTPARSTACEEYLVGKPCHEEVLQEGGGERILMLESNVITVNFSVNGEEHSISVPPHRTLLWVLREGLGLTGTKHGCGTGECGACTVHIDGEPYNACWYWPPRSKGGR